MIKSCLRYPGGKSRAISKLAQFVPKGYTKLGSPFLGGGSFELFCNQTLGFSVSGSDKFVPLVHFWNTSISNNLELVKKIQTFLPSVSREQFEKMQYHLALLSSPLDIAAYFFVLNRCSFSGNISGGFTSYKMAETGQNPRFNENSIRCLERYTELKNFTVTYGSFDEVIPRYTEDMFVYLDPPYIIKDKIYGQQGDNLHEIDHVILRDLLRECKSPWLLSYNDCAAVRDLYKGFIVLDNIEWQYGMSASKQSKELVIMSTRLYNLLYTPKD